MHARAVGDIDEVSHNKRAGKNETIMIMRRAVCATATEDLERRHSRSHGTKSYILESFHYLLPEVITLDFKRGRDMEARLQ